MKIRLLAIILSVLMIISAIPAAAFAVDDGNGGWHSVSFEVADGSTSGLLEKYGMKENTQDETKYSTKDRVRVSIVLNDVPAVEKYQSDDVLNNAAVVYRSRLRSNQDKVAEKISKTVLKGKKLDVVWNLTLAANIISANVEYGKIEEIKKLSEVKNVVIESRHSIDEDEYNGETADPLMTTAGDMTYTYPVWAEGYTGAGTSVAVIDTGIDTKHKSFDEGAFEYALSTLEEEVDLITREDISAVFDQLNIKKKNPELTVDDVYLTSKIPFAFNYVDNDTDVTHLNDTEGEHGSHVAGIATANRYVPDGNGGYEDALTAVKTQGQAPDAQLIVMKVFGRKGGAYDADYFAAIEDAIVLGLDVANLSLGSPNPGFANDPDYEQLLDDLDDCNMVIAISAGNSAYWAKNTYMGLPYAEDKSMTMLGDPASLTNSLAVASVDNSGMTASIIKFADRDIFYSETSSYGADPLLTLKGEQEFIAIDGYGLEEDFAALTDVLPGKIFICSRGENSFFEKADSAVENGATATIIYNNSAASVSMNLTGYKYTEPVVIISLDDGGFIKENAQKVTDEDGNILYYTGTISIPEGVVVKPSDSDYYIMSDFSSWGTNGSLELKPEITAPGGNIYSVYGENANENGFTEAVGNDRYKLMSGTSMASPQIAGISALIAEYIRKNDLETKTGMTKRHLTNSLLMGTAAPITEESSGNFYSVLKQGAGLVDAEAAVSTHTYITMEEDATASYADGKVKAEVGEISRDDKTFDFTFKINNFGSEATDYYLFPTFFTQDYTNGPDYDCYGYKKYDENGNIKTRLYMDLATTDDLYTNVVWTVDGEVLYAEDSELYDFDADGIFSYSDIQVLLEYIVGNIDEFNLMENADVDEDGDIDTFDAYTLRGWLNIAEITVPAGGYATVNVSVTLIDIDYYDINGAYVEGYVFILEGDGNYVVSSIPVLGYYGNWAEPNTFDYGTYKDYIYGTGETAPYISSGVEYNAYCNNYFTISYPGVGSYVSMGNPYGADEIYMPERDAISTAATLDSVCFTLIRSVAECEVLITDANGSELFRQSYGAANSTFFISDSDYMNWADRNKVSQIGFSPSMLKDGDVITATFRTALEYYTQKGEADWDSFPESTRLSKKITVDGTAPDILNVEFHYNDDLGVYDAARIVCRDNQYTSFIGLFDEYDNLICSVGSDNNPKAKPGALRETVFDLSEAYEDLTEVPEHFTAYVIDYAANETHCFINLNKTELAEDRRVETDKDGLELAVGSTEHVEAAVKPWGKNCDVIWTSDNEEVATVDEEGTVTGVGVGSTVITATAEDFPDVFKKLTVSVVRIESEYTGALWDEGSDVWPVTFIPENLPECVFETDEPIPYKPIAFCYGVDGALYGATFNSSDSTSDFYTVDEDTYEGTYLGTSDFGYTDIAAAPAVSAYLEHQYMTGTLLDSILIFDTADGGCVDALDFGDYSNENSIVGIALESSVIDKDSGVYVDNYYIIDMTGRLYYAQISMHDTEDGVVFDIIAVYDLGIIGDEVDCIANQSLYFDTNGYLVWTRTYEKEAYVYIYIYDVSDQDNIIKYDFGTLDVDVWPLAGIFEKDKYIAFDYSDLVKLDGESENTAEFVNTVSVSEMIGAKTKTEKAGVSVNSVEADQSRALRFTEKNAKNNIGFNFVSFDVKADIYTVNGLYTVSFDPEVYVIDGIYVYSEFSAVNVEDGLITVAFVSVPGFYEDESIMTIELYAVSDGLKTVTVTAKEVNDEHPETEEYLFVTDTPAYSAPEWEWYGEYESAAAVFTRTDGLQIRVDAAIETETIEPTCTEEGAQSYLATVEFEGKTYADMKMVVKEALGHDLVHHDAKAPTCTEPGWDAYDTCSRCDYSTYNEISALGHVYGEPEWTWSENNDTASAKFACSECDHAKVIEAVVIRSESKGVITYTAVTVFNDKTYKDEKTEYVEYTVIFADHDGTVISERTYHYGDEITAPDDPVRKEDDKYTYTFKGWDKAPAKVTEDATYTAVYDAAEKPQFIPGDINGDESVNNKDVVILFRYLGGESVTVNEIALDTNGDGEVNNKDVTLLFRYINDNSIELSDKPYSKA